MQNIIPNDAQSPELSRRLEDSKPSEDIFNSLLKRHKAQIESDPNVSPQDRNRYKVTIAGEVIACRLSCIEAFELAKKFK